MYLALVDRFAIERSLETVCVEVGLANPTNHGVYYFASPYSNHIFHALHEYVRPFKERGESGGGGDRESVCVGTCVSLCLSFHLTHTHIRIHIRTHIPARIKRHCSRFPALVFAGELQALGHRKSDLIFESSHQLR